MVLTRTDGLPPFLIVQIPLDGFLDAVLELGLWQPAKFIVDFGRLDGVTHIVTLAIANTGDMTFRLN